jgi:ribonuclease R
MEQGFPLASPQNLNALTLGIIRHILQVQLKHIHLRKILKKSMRNKENKTRMIDAIEEVFRNEPAAVYNYKQVIRRIGIKGRSQHSQVMNLLYRLVEEDVLIETDKGRFRYNNLGAVTEGIFQRRSNGKNTVLLEEGGISVRVAERNSAHAMNGDRVKIQVFAHRKGYEPEAEVLEILQSKEKNYIGILRINRDYSFLITEDKTLAHDIFIPRDKLGGGKNGEKAVVKIIEWPENAKNPIGEVIDILGKAGNNDTEMHAILAEFGLPYRYPENVEKAANGISGKITEQDLAEREDFRPVVTITIDPKDAKDFDDALSVRKLDDGCWEVGVHIADVTHFVKPGSIIDREGYERATSVYLVDRTVPMLPERLSNELCSLRQDEEKCCFSVIFHLDGNADIRSSRIVRTLIKSDRRFDYDEVQDIIETGRGDFRDEVLKLDELAKMLREKRFKKGAIDFDRYEVKFELDEKGRPTNVCFRESKDSNHLVEEFMLLANKCVAETLGRAGKGKTKKTFVYRIHDRPDADKLQHFAEFISRLGYKLKTSGSKSDISKNINTLLDKSKGKPEQNLIETLAIRSMQKAVYSTKNVGHYGLAFPYYTHFTSPIRRYPDMMVHRLIDRYLNGEKSVSPDEYEEFCKHCSAMEQTAAAAERESIKYKQVEYMDGKTGYVYHGVISGVTEWGIYVELNENKCEGLVSTRDLVDDFYVFDEKNYCLRGKRHNREYRLGDPVKVKVKKTNLAKKQIDFILAE